MLKWLYELVYGEWIKRVETLEEDIKVVEKIADDYITEVDIKNKEIEKLENKLKAYEPKTYEKPDFLASGYVYSPVVQAVEQGGKISTYKLNYKDFYATSISLEEEAKKWMELDYNKKLLAIWKFVIERIGYKYDENESWQLPPLTHCRKFGDCEDGTLMFLALCKLTGILPTDVFNACGWYIVGKDKIGHSYPIAKMDGKWYVFETTIDKVPSSPKLFKGSNYDASWGLQNWEWANAIKDGVKNGYQI